jgi:hypothetical protein
MSMIKQKFLSILSLSFLIIVSFAIGGCVTVPTTTTASPTPHTTVPQQRFGLIIRPVGNPDPTPPKKYEDFLQKVGGLELTYVRTLANQAYVFTTEPTDQATLHLTIKRLMSHPYIRYAEEDKVMKITR